MSSLRQNQPKLTVIEGQIPAKHIAELDPDNPKAHSLAKWFLIAFLALIVMICVSAFMSRWR